MPFYDFYCSEHDTHEEVYCTVSKLPEDGMKGCPKCPECDEFMIQNFNRKAGKDSRTGVGNYANGVVSQALAINPDQLAEHNQLFPGVEVLPDGCIKFDSYKQHDNYLKKAGFQKLPQKLKGLGAVRIDK